MIWPDYIGIRDLYLKETTSTTFAIDPETMSLKETASRYFPATKSISEILRNGVSKNSGTPNHPFE